MVIVWYSSRTSCWKRDLLNHNLKLSHPIQSWYNGYDYLPIPYSELHMFYKKRPQVLYYHSPGSHCLSVELWRLPILCNMHPPLTLYQLSKVRSHHENTLCCYCGLLPFGRSPSGRVRNAANVSISWYHHIWSKYVFAFFLGATPSLFQTSSYATQPHLLASHFLESAQTSSYYFVYWPSGEQENIYKKNILKGVSGIFCFVLLGACG